MGATLGREVQTRLRTSASMEVRQLGSQACACRSSSVTVLPLGESKHRVLPHTPELAAEHKHNRSAQTPGVKLHAWLRFNVRRLRASAMRRARGLNSQIIHGTR